jgi:hypothetical protein
MIVIRRLALSVMGAAVLIAGCTSITIPSIPPIPTVPPGFTIPPIPTFPPIELPSGFNLPSADASSGACALVTAAEMSTIMGGSFSVSANDGTSCTFTSGLGGVIVSVTPDTDLTGARFLFGDSVTDVTVGGFPGISGRIFGQPGVYVQKPTGQLAVQGILLGEDPATLDRLVQVANTAVARMP